jgi:hypothetical protein
VENLRPNTTKGERRIGRTIRKIKASVELSSKESFAKEDEKKYRERAKQTFSCPEDSPIQNLRYLTDRKKDYTTP